MAPARRCVCCRDAAIGRGVLEGLCVCVAGRGGAWGNMGVPEREEGGEGGECAGGAAPLDGYDDELMSAPARCYNKQGDGRLLPALSVDSQYQKPCYGKLCPSDFLP